jgi:hypothetical protein
LVALLVPYDDIHISEIANVIVIAIVTGIVTGIVIETAIKSEGIVIKTKIKKNQEEM